MARTQIIAVNNCYCYEDSFLSITKWIRDDFVFVSVFQFTVIGEVMCGGVMERCNDPLASFNNTLQSAEKF
jgi:hypothetical protein